MVVPPEGLRTPERVELLSEVIGLQTGGDLIVLPAGAVRAADEAGVRKAAAPLIAAAKKVRAAVIVGVDAEPPRRTARGRVKNGTLPYFLVAWSPDDGVKVWRQRSLTGGNATDVPEVMLAERRVLHVAGMKVAPVACGEIYNPAIRAGVAELMPTAAVLSAHFAAGARHWAPQDCLRKLGVPSVRSVHSAQATVDPLFDPRGYASPSLSLMWRGVFVRVFHLDEARRRKAA
jgi:hypothetical protein